MAIVVPDEEMLMRWANTYGRKESLFEELCQDEVKYLDFFQ